MNRNLILPIIAFIIGFYVANLTTTRAPKLEIYTQDNIYFLDGLEVTNEANDTILIFEKNSDLEEFIGELTAESTNLIN